MNKRKGIYEAYLELLGLLKGMSQLSSFAPVGGKKTLGSLNPKLPRFKAQENTDACRCSYLPIFINIWMGTSI